MKKGCASHNDAALAAIIERRPELVILIGRWANVASDRRAPGDGEPPGRIVDAETGREMALADALIRTIDIMRSFDVRVIVVGPVPEVEFDVPATLNRALRGLACGAVPDGRLRQAAALGARCPGAGGSNGPCAGVVPAQGSVRWTRVQCGVGRIAAIRGR